MSIQENALIVSLRISLPPQSRKAFAASDAVEMKYKTAHRQAAVVKQLFSKKDVKIIQRAAQQARQYFNEASLPYEDGRRIIPSANYFEFVSEMSKYSSAFDDAAVKLIRNYHLVISRAEFELGELFDENNYPTADQLEARMNFSIDSTVIPKSNAFDDLAGLDEEAIEKLKADARAGEKDKIEVAMRDLVSRLFTSLSHAVSKLSDEDAIFRDSLIKNIDHALEAIKTLNLTNDVDLIEIAEKVKSSLEGITAEDLRKDKELRSKTAKEAQEMIDKLSEFY